MSEKEYDFFYWASVDFWDRERARLMAKHGYKYQDREWVRS